MINKNLQKISSHALQLSNHLQQMNDQYGQQVQNQSSNKELVHTSLSDTKNLNDGSSREGHPPSGPYDNVG
jgi:hypothetical protein